MDIVITKANVQNSDAGALISGDAAVAIVAGQVVAKNTAGKFILADANAAVPANKPVGIALNDADIDQPLSVCTRDPDFVFGGTAAIGDVVILSGTPGGIAPYADQVAGWFTSVLGVAKSTTTINLTIVQSGAAKA